VATQSKFKMKRRPSHPGAILSACLPDTGMNAAEFAVTLGVRAARLRSLLNEGSRMTPDMAHRLARAFGTSAEVWLRLQDALDLWDAEQRGGADYSRIVRVTPGPPVAVAALTSKS
jgi:addiction module HigA family antidote